jgi:hypothetical protein
MPGVRPFDVPALPGLDRRLIVTLRIIWPSSSGSLSSAATIMSSKRPGSTSPTYDAHDSDFRR